MEITIKRYSRKMTYEDAATCNETRKTQVSTGKGGTGRDFMGYRRKLWNFNGKSPHFDGKSILFL